MLLVSLLGKSKHAAIFVGFLTLALFSFAQKVDHLRVEVVSSIITIIGLCGIECIALKRVSTSLTKNFVNQIKII